VQLQRHRGLRRPSRNVVRWGSVTTGNDRLRRGLVITKGAGNLGWPGTKCGFPPRASCRLAQAARRHETAVSEV